MRRVYEIHDPDFQPRQARAGLFHIDPPFSFGDTNLDNNIAVIQVSLGGHSNGFE